jgi:hypothetical protein
MTGVAADAQVYSGMPINSIISIEAKGSFK